MRTDNTTAAAAVVPGRRHVDVLLVEDERADYLLMRRAMSKCEQLDIALRWVRRVSEVPEAIERFAPDVVLLDLHLPDAVRGEAFDRIRRTVDNVPIIVVTGQTDGGHGLDYVRRGAQDFMRKDTIVAHELERSILFALERSRHRRTLERMALYDPLTGLPNRVLLTERIDSAIQRARRRMDCCGVVYIDLDDFKPVNDQWGHATGDLVLRSVALTLRAGVRRSDTIARMGGDEFVCLLEDVRDIDAVLEVAGNLLERVRRPFDLAPGPGRDPVAFALHASAGVAIAPLEAMDGHALVELADARMYRAKAMGGNRVAAVDDDDA